MILKRILENLLILSQMGWNAFERNVKRIGDCLFGLYRLGRPSLSPFVPDLLHRRKGEGWRSLPFSSRSVSVVSGRPFNIYKFRSMRLDAEKFGPALYKEEVLTPHDPCWQVPA